MAIRSPIFVAHFSDGTITRMTTWHDPRHESFDLIRGIRLAHEAAS